MAGLKLVQQQAVDELLDNRKNKGYYFGVIDYKAPSINGIAFPYEKIIVLFGSWKAFMFACGRKNNRTCMVEDYIRVRIELRRQLNKGDYFKLHRPVLYRSADIYVLFGSWSAFRLSIRNYMKNRRIEICLKF